MSVRTRKPALAAMLEHGRLLRFGPAGVELGFVKRLGLPRFGAGLEARALALEEVLEAQMGSRVPFRIRELESDSVEGERPLAEQHRVVEQRAGERFCRDEVMEDPADPRRSQYHGWRGGRGSASL